MKAFFNTQSMIFGLSIGIAIFIGMMQGPKNVDNALTALLWGTGSEDYCNYSFQMSYCPNEPGQTGCTDEYNDFVDYGYMEFLTLSKIEDNFTWCEDIEPTLNGGDIDGPCDNSVGDQQSDPEELCIPLESC